MAKRLLWTIMLLASTAMLLLMAGWLLWKLGLGLVAGLLYAIAGKTMLLAFAGLLVIAVLYCLRQMACEIKRYFGAEARARRRLWSIRLREIDVKQYWAARVRQLRYRAAFKRRALMVADNRKQLRGLFRAIDADLRGAKAQLPGHDYRQLRKALRQSHRQADAAAMLAIRERLPCH